jgi:hypothetical protein
VIVDNVFDCALVSCTVKTGMLSGAISPKVNQQSRTKTFCQDAVKTKQRGDESDK